MAAKILSRAEGQVVASILLASMVYVAALLNYLFQIVMSIMLAPDTLTVVLTFNSLFLIAGVASSALQTSAVRGVVSGSSDAGFLWRFWVEGNKRVLIRGTVLAVGLIGSSVVWARLLNVLDVLLVLLFGTTVMLIFVLAFNRGVLQGRDRVWWLGGSIIFWAAARFGLAVVLVIFGLGVAGVLTSYLLASLLSITLCALGLRNLIGGARPWRMDTARPSADGQHTLLPILLLATLVNGDILLARYFLPVEDAALFAVVSVLAKVCFFGTNAITWAMFPRVLAAFRDGRNPTSILALALGLAGLLAAMFLVVYGLIPSMLLEFLFQDQYRDAANYLLPYTIAMGAFGFTYLLVHFGLAARQRWLSMVLIMPLVALLVAVGFGPKSIDWIVLSVVVIALGTMTATAGLVVHSAFASNRQQSPIGPLSL